MLAALAESAYGASIRVAPGELRQALATALDGDTLVVLPGFHEGNLVIAKRITLAAEGNAVIHGSGLGSTVTLLADSCSISGLTIEHCGTMLVGEDAGILIKSDGNTVSNNRLRDVLFGIYLFQASGNDVTGNTIVGRRELELGERGSGIHIWNSHLNRFSWNTITDTRDGFYIQNANRTVVEDNRVYGVRYGLHYMYADSNVFLRNLFADNVAGAAVMYSRCITIRHNVFYRNRGFASFGILFQDCSSLSVDSNVVADNVVGLFFEATSGNMFRNNIIAQNDIALEMFQNSIQNEFVENNFIDNLTPLMMVGRSTGSHWSIGGRGNFWTSYDGYDLDGDGVGDVPMKIENVFQYLEGRNLNVRLYLYSPASQALAAAVRAFPVIPISDEADAAPLMRPVALGSMPSVDLLETTRMGSTGGRNPGWIVVPSGLGIGLIAVYRVLVRRKSS